MGFFGALGKVLAGKPIFEPDNNARSGEGQAASRTSGSPPVVRITRVESPIRGDRLEVHVDIRNESNVPVFLDKISVLGTTRELDSDLAPGVVREFTAYVGPALKNDSHRDAELQYRTQDGEYFEARFDVRFYKESDGLHIGGFQPDGPIRQG
jgi:hypothetical protein